VLSNQEKNSKKVNYFKMFALLRPLGQRGVACAMHHKQDMH